MDKHDLEHFTVASATVAATDGQRLDATYYNPRAAHVLRTLDTYMMDVQPLGELTDKVFMPPRFKRTYVTADRGVPLLQGSHVVQFRPADLKYLSLAATKNVEDLLIRHGWLLVTRSGTVGRVALVPTEWDGWAASEHIFRIVPKVDGRCPAGYLATFLDSPLGQAQLSAQVYGAVVDELTEDHIRNIRVPVPRTPAQRAEVKRINDLTLRALELRAEAANAFVIAEESLQRFLPFDQ